MSHIERSPSADTFGLKCWRGMAPPMARCHSHNDIEFNLVETGAVTYLYGGRQTRVGAGQLAVFWASLPHQIVEREPETTMQWLNLPLSLFLQWRLPLAFTQAILGGQLVSESDEAYRALDLALFACWREDLAPGKVGNGEEQDAYQGAESALLEIEARLRRLSRSLVEGQRMVSPPPSAQHTAAFVSRGEMSKVARMSRFVAEHYQQQVSVADIAQSVGLHPNYAAPLFCKEFGMSLTHYIARYRLSHAQRLLATTQNDVLSIALECGFGSVSRFYAVFKQACGQSPRQYRASVQGIKIADAKG